MKLKNKVFNLAEVYLHNSSKDCWVIINARVYDVTNFLNDHPGGYNVLLDVAGKNASEEFEEVGHGSAARLMLDEYYIGEVDLATSSYGISTTITPITETHPKVKKKTIIQEDKKSRFAFMLKPIGLLLPLAIFGVAINFVLYKRRENILFL